MLRIQHSHHWLASIVVTAGLALSTPAWAEYVWLQSNGNRTFAQAGELTRPMANTSALREARAVLPDGRSAPAEAQGSTFVLAPAGDDQRFAMQATEDTSTYFKALYGRQETKAVNDLELVPTEVGGSSFRPFFEGRPANASHVNVESAAGWHKSLTPNPDGTVTLDTLIPGLYVLEVSARVNNASVNIDGKKYEDVRHTATLSFEVSR